VLVIPFLAGCGGGGGSVTAPVIPTPTVLTASAVAANGLTGTLSQSAVTVPVGGSVQYTFVLTNTTSKSVVLHIPYYGEQPPSVSAILQVKDPAGNLVYRDPPPNVAVGGPFRDEDVTLQAGQTMSETVQVNDFKAKGLYTATASFFTGTDTQTGNITANPSALTVLAQ